jgi:hypothetical protein
MILIDCVKRWWSCTKHKDFLVISTINKINSGRLYIRSSPDLEQQCWYLSFTDVSGQQTWAQFVSKIPDTNISLGRKGITS